MVRCVHSSTIQNQQIHIVDVGGAKSDIYDYLVALVWFDLLI